MNRIKKAVAASLITCAPFSVYATGEIESNDTLATAQVISIPSIGNTISGFVGAASSSDPFALDPFGGTTTTSTAPDVDFFRFNAVAGDIYTLDVDNGSGGIDPVDTIIALYDESGKMLRSSDDASSVDEGSLDIKDPRIENFVVPADGTYVVGIAAYPQYFLEGGDVANMVAGEAGDYELVVSYQAPAPVVYEEPVVSPVVEAAEPGSADVQQVGIEVKPGSRGMSRLNPNSRGKLPVAILGSDMLDVESIDQDSLRFGATGTEDSLHNCKGRVKDVNHDGYSDLVCRFYTFKADFNSGSLEGKLSGMTTDGTAFEGVGALKVVPYEVQH